MFSLQEDDCSPVVLVVPVMHVPIDVQHVEESARHDSQLKNGIKIWRVLITKDLHYITEHTKNEFKCPYQAIIILIYYRCRSNFAYRKLKNEI